MNSKALAGRAAAPLKRARRFRLVDVLSIVPAQGSGAGEDHMTVKKRNELASMASTFVSEAISELRTAEQNIRDNKPNEALKWIAETLIHLDPLREACAEACEERAAEEAGRLVGED